MQTREEQRHNEKSSTEKGDVDAGEWSGLLAEADSMGAWTLSDTNLYPDKVLMMVQDLATALRDAEAARVRAEGERDEVTKQRDVQWDSRKKAEQEAREARAALTDCVAQNNTLRAQLDAVTRERDEAIARAEQAERNEAACRAALEEIGYTGALPEGAYDKLVRERDLPHQYRAIKRVIREEVLP